MTERSPSPERPRLTDDELIDQEIASAIELEAPISDAAARVIASQIHGGMSSALYSFTSTGFIDERLLDEIAHEYDPLEEDDPQRTRIAFLAVYVATRRAAGEVAADPDWSGLWLEDRGEQDLCPACHEHISKNHRVGCPLGVDEQDQLDRVLQLQEYHGNGILRWLNYVGFRTLDELNEQASRFSQYFYGFFPDVETFARNYEVDPRTYLAQQYEIVEGDGGVYVFDR